MQRTHTVPRGTFAKAPLARRYGEDDRRSFGGDKPRLAVFSKWSGSVVNRASQPTPPWLAELRRAHGQPKNPWNR